MIMDDQTAPPLDARWQALQEAASRLVKASTAAEKNLRAVNAASADPQGALAALAALAPLRASLDAPPLAAPALSAIEAEVTESVDAWRMRWLGELSRAAEAAGVEFARLTSDEVRVGEATVRLHLSRGEAEVCYAREVLDTVRAEPAVVVAAAQRVIATLRRPIDDAPAIFDELVAAYRVLLARSGQPFGERVSLVDLITPLFFVRQPDGFWRAQLAFDLDTLQRARCLERGGLRIALGTATGGSTAKKQQVLFLESAPAGGQYFLTFALRAVEAP
jgi:hypothetical protein